MEGGGGSGAGANKIPLSAYDPSWATRGGRYMSAIVAGTRQRFPDAPKGSNERKLKGGQTMSLYSIMPPTSLARSASFSDSLSVASAPASAAPLRVKLPELPRTTMQTPLRSSEGGRFGFRSNFELSSNALQLDSEDGDTKKWFTDLKERRRLRAVRKRAAQEARRVANSPYSRKQRFVAEPATLEETLRTWEGPLSATMEEGVDEVRGWCYRAIGRGARWREGDVERERAKV